MVLFPFSIYPAVIIDVQPVGLQGVGMLLSPLFVMICIASGVPLSLTWRICLFFGAIPSSIAFFFRWRMHETKAFKKSRRTMLIEMSDTTPRKRGATSVYFVSEASHEYRGRSQSHHAAYSSFNPIHKFSDWISQSLNPQRTTSGIPYTALECDICKQGDVILSSPSVAQSSVSSIPETLSKDPCLPAFGRHLKHLWRTLKRFRKTLIGTAMCWFLIDVTLYGTGSFETAVIASMFDGTTPLESRVLQESLDQPLAGTHSSNFSFLLQQSFDPSTLNLLTPDPPYLSELSKLNRTITFMPTPQRIRRDVVRSFLNSIFKSEEAVEFVRTQHHSLSPDLNHRFLLDETAKEIADREKIMNEAKMSIVVALLAIPGYILSTLYVHIIGLKNLQLTGFIAVAIVFLLLGTEQLFNLNIIVLELMLFGLTFLFCNFGPNTTTFILPTQLYPTSVRATYHGFSAAMGKLGGVFGTSLFGIVQEQLGLGGLLIVCGCVSLIGAVFTIYFIPNEDQGKRDQQM